MPQKQPPAITAVSFAGEPALVSSTVGPGTGTPAPLPALQAITPAKRINTIANMRSEILDIVVPPSSDSDRLNYLCTIRVTSAVKVSDVLSAFPRTLLRAKCASGGL